MLESVILETGPDPRWAVIWLHGLGADGHDFEGIVPELPLPPVPVRFVFPHAPVMRVRVNGGAPMRAWYDVALSDLSRYPDLEGMFRSVGHLQALAKRETERGIPAERIILAGFSQGGVIALLTVFGEGARRWGGVLALSTYLPLEAGITLADSPTPLFMVHGTEDPVVPFRLGRKSFEVLEGLGGMGSRKWQQYAMGHSVCLPEIGAIGAFLGGILEGGGGGEGRQI
ncbi:MAG: alpha/beta hydrolase [Nitrospirae bacterium]|nr:alpha/beta hydrolase [Nitrospirota bacterium]